LKIVEKCGTDLECYKKGSRWSAIYIINGIITLLLALNMGCVLIGSKHLVPRMMAGLSAPFLCCAHVGVCIATAVLRYTPPGMLCSLSNAPTNWVGKPELVTDLWTYKKDGLFILICWVLQMCAMSLCTITAIRPIFFTPKAKGF